MGGVISVPKVSCSEAKYSSIGVPRGEESGEVGGNGGRSDDGSGIVPDVAIDVCVRWKWSKNRVRIASNF